jgi:competence ComEA-like helix-hairpin-helix protein
MGSLKSLDISDYHGNPLSNTFVQQDQVARQLAIVFPGWGYTTHKPLLHYTTHLLADHGADILLVEYEYHRKPAFGKAPAAERSRWLSADAKAALEAGLAQRAYEQIVLAGKSIGTLAMGRLTATAAELQELPGVGPSTAQKIVDYRETNGPFEKIEDIMDVPTIGEAKFEGIKYLITVGP